MRLPWPTRRGPPPLDAAKAQSEALLSHPGDADGGRVATRLADLYRALGESDLLGLFEWLAADLGADEARLAAAASAYLESPSPERASALSAAAEPRRQELFRRLNAAPGGTALIVTLRSRLLGLLPDRPALAPLDADLKHLLASWFNRGFLELRRIDWNSPAAILEKLIAYEAVHAIRDWDDLRGRLAGDRRCYGFFHPALPGEPLIFVEVALTDRISDAIAPLLDHPPVRAEPAAPTTAIFYSISNCQQGLRGISFGNFLIKQIVDDLKAEAPSLKTFATLSPVPGFRRWLDGRGGTGDIKRQCALYLTERDPARRPDPVASFHLSNGARLERINLDADLSDKGLAQSHGVMVNYRYVDTDLVDNHHAFVERGEVAMSSEVAALLEPARRPLFGRVR